MLLFSPPSLLIALNFYFGLSRLFYTILSFGNSFNRPHLMYQLYMNIYISARKMQIEYDLYSIIHATDIDISHKTCHNQMRVFQKRENRTERVVLVFLNSCLKIVLNLRMVFVV